MTFKICARCFLSHSVVLRTSWGPRCIYCVRLDREARLRANSHDRYLADRVAKAIARSFIVGLGVENGSGPTVRQKTGAPRGALKQRLTLLVRQLPNEDRLLLREIFWHDRTLEDVAADYKVHRTTVYRWVIQILDTLRRQLGSLVPKEAPPILQFEAQMRDLAVLEKEAQANDRRPPIPGYVIGRRFPGLIPGRGWGAPTWRCGHCQTVQPVTQRRCTCRLFSVGGD